MMDQHRPDPEFVSNLEWQVRTALRREARFAEPVGNRRGRRMQMVALVLISALLGAGGVVAKDEMQEARRQEILLAEVAAEKRMAAMEMELFRTRVEEAQEMYEGGLTTVEALRNARVRLREVEVKLSRLLMDEEEIRITGRNPDDGLSAPLLGGRDFVTQRLALEAAVISEQREAARADLARLQELRDQGLVGEEAVSRARTVVAGLDVRIQEAAGRLELRERVLAGEISGEAAENLLELRRTRSELAALVGQRDDARIRMMEAEARVADGALPDSYLQEARLQLMEVETRLELLRLKLEILEEGDG